MLRLRSAARLVIVIALAASTQGLLLAQASWLANRDWIAETLCVNPETDCDGMCQLSDRMEAMSHEMGDDEHSDSHSHEDPAVLLELALSVRAHVTDRVGVSRPDGADGGPLRAARVMDTGREASRGVFHPPRPAASA